MFLRVICKDGIGQDPTPVVYSRSLRAAREDHTAPSL